MLRKLNTEGSRSATLNKFGCRKLRHFNSDNGLVTGINRQIGTFTAGITIQYCKHHQVVHTVSQNM